MVYPLSGLEDRKIETMTHELSARPILFLAVLLYLLISGGPVLSWSGQSGGQDPQPPWRVGIRDTEMRFLKSKMNSPGRIKA